MDATQARQTWHTLIIEPASGRQGSAFHNGSFVDIAWKDGTRERVRLDDGVRLNQLRVRSMYDEWSGRWNGEPYYA